MPATGITKTEGAFWVAGGAIICALAWRAGVGSFQEPGPGFVALVSGLLILIVSSIMTASAAVSGPSRGDDRRRAFQGILWFRLGYTMALLLAYALLVESLGYILTASAMMWGLLYDRGRRHWAVSLVIAVLAVGISYLVFDVWLRSQLPRGRLPW